jgi:hypothetical protein
MVCTNAVNITFQKLLPMNVESLPVDTEAILANSSLISNESYIKFFSIYAIYDIAFFIC